MALNTRFISESPSDIDAWVRAVYTGFFTPPELITHMEERRAKQDFSRARGVFDGDRCVATFRSFDQELTVPGGAIVTSNAVSAVTVAATHRRRGLLSGLMTEDLAAARERGAAAATLIAAEYRIYGRFGFGPAASAARWEVDVHRAGLDPRWTLPGAEGSLAFADAEEVRKLGPELHERFRRGRAGAVHRPPLWWERNTGAVRFDPEPWKERFWVLHRDAEGVPQGLAAFRVEERSVNGAPNTRATVMGLLAATPAAERALWRFLLSIDWLATLDTGMCDPDSLLPGLLPDPRAALLKEQADFLWLRPLDVPRLLEARGYAAEGSLVLDIRDPLGLSGGRFLLDAGPEGASCAPTSRPADLTLGAGTFAKLYLGEVTAAKLAALGELDEDTARASDRADLLFRTGRRPWCPDGF
ncbi:GNAT family N-acetyltransferase [Streptomyces hoynatensis]|uniref:GNAT family N-acetyltransferase n=1 Tax=Streptomyces hoynatensis TaxID=1141874 RepID=A0A3A9Z0Z8_9ACTN|nr:GNAT family N-acetyltransferase [Streptomyces hoynatensis]RKN41810.1 GNAT family N-acetyltransferase [Streptomyces hoynatensis]